MRIQLSSANEKNSYFPLRLEPLVGYKLSRVALGTRMRSKLLLLTKEFSKHPHILAIFKVDSEYLTFPFKAKVDYFRLHSILVYIFVIFLIFLAMNKRRCTFKGERFFHWNVYIFKRKQKWTTAYQHVISRASHISVSIKGTFWYLSLLFLEWSTITVKPGQAFPSLTN